MSTTLETKLRTAAALNSSLSSLLGSSPFRWYDMQEYQGSAFPSVTVQLISAVNQYSLTDRLVNTRCRVQFTVWDSDPERARSVETAIIAFLDTFNAFDALNAPKSRQPNEVLMRRQGGNANTQPLTFWRIVDASIWNNENI